VHASVLFAGHAHAITLLLELPVDAGQLLSVDSAGCACLWEATTGNCILRREVPALAGDAALTAVHVPSSGAVAVLTRELLRSAPGKAAPRRAARDDDDDDGGMAKFERMMGGAKLTARAPGAAAVRGPQLVLLSLDSLAVLQQLAPGLGVTLSRRGDAEGARLGQPVQCEQWHARLRLLRRAGRCRCWRGRR